jgi:hypothetical protein
MLCSVRSRNLDANPPLHLQANLERKPFSLLDDERKSEPIPAAACKLLFGSYSLTANAAARQVIPNSEFVNAMLGGAVGTQNQLRVSSDVPLLWIRLL